jgi:hypothetical protein
MTQTRTGCAEAKRNLKSSVYFCKNYSHLYHLRSLISVDCVPKTSCSIVHKLFLLFPEFYRLKSQNFNSLFRFCRHQESSSKKVIMSVQEQLGHITTAIGKLTEKIDKTNEKVDKTNESVELTNQGLDEMKDLLQARVKVVEEKIDDISSRVCVLERRNDQRDDNYRRVNNLLLSGVPFSSGENLRDIFAVVAAKLGYSTPPDADVFRYNGSDPEKRPIVIKFATDFHKRHFFERYFKVSKSITLDAFPGFKGKKSRVYLQQDFTSVQYKLYRAATNHKKAGIIEKVRVEQGIVSVKFANSSAFVMFPTADALDRETQKIIAAK